MVSLVEGDPGESASADVHPVKSASVRRRERMADADALLQSTSSGAKTLVLGALDLADLAQECDRVW